MDGFCLIRDERRKNRTDFAVRVVIVEDAKSDGWQNAGKVEEERRREDLLGRLDTRQSIFVVGNVMRKTTPQVFTNSLPKVAQFVSDGVDSAVAAAVVVTGGRSVVSVVM